MDIDFVKFQNSKISYWEAKFPTNGTLVITSLKDFSKVELFEEIFDS
jgi:hypothetical protein